LLITMIRTVILYFVIVGAIRALGKRQSGELEPAELAIVILIADLAAVPMQNTELPILLGLIPIIVLMSIGIILSLITMKSPLARRIFYGKPSIIIENGRLNQAEIQRLRLNLDEIAEELRLKNVTDLTTVKYGILETDGNLSLILYPKYQPVTVGDLDLEPKSTAELNITLITNGRLLKDNLPLAGLTREDIEKALKEKNISRMKDVFYMLKRPDGSLFIVKDEKRARKT
jgi:uncharacterized membrane protein YcaP (DUF421 family)